LPNRPKTNPYGKSISVPLKNQDFSKLIADHGIYVRHEKVTICPHVYNQESNHADITCNVCDNGKITFDSKDVWLLLYSVKMEQMPQVQGIWETGDVLATFPGYYEDLSVVRVDYIDKITILDFSERMSDLVVRDSSNDIDRIRYEVVDVHDIRTKTTVYEKDTDFVIEDTNIKWISANRPSAGEVYALAYQYRPVYRILSFFHESRYYYDSFKKPIKTPVYHPIQAQIRRDYILEDRKGYN